MRHAYSTPVGGQRRTHSAGKLGAGDTGAMLITSRNFDDRKTTEIISIEQQLPDQARLDGGQEAGQRRLGVAAAATADLVAQLRR